MKKIKTFAGHAIKGVGIFTLLYYMSGYDLPINISFNSTPSRLELIVEQGEGDPNVNPLGTSIKMMRVNRKDDKKLYDFMEKEGYIKNGEYRLIWINGTE